MSPRALIDRIEGWVDPIEREEREALDRLATFVDGTLDRDEGRRLERDGELPRAWLAAFARAGLAREMAPADAGGSLSWPRLMRVTARLAAHDVDFALVLGGAVLGGLPLLVAGSAAQRATYFEAIARGELGALALSEWAHGSDLLANEVVARPCDAAGNDAALDVATHFELRGEKGPVNNGGAGAFVVTLARTRPENDPFAQSLFLVPRAAVARARKRATIGHRNMDLAEIVFDGARLDRAALVGEAGEGFAIVRRALTVSRSGVAAQALGPMFASLSLMIAHARERRLYGDALFGLAAVRELLGAAVARTTIATALVRRAARTACFGVGAAGWTSAAKYLVPTLMEEVVHDATTLLGARGVLDEHPLARIRRASPTFAIFDGSSQLQLDELWRYALAWRPGHADLAARHAALRSTDGGFPLGDAPSLDRDLASPLAAVTSADDALGLDALADLARALPDLAAQHREGAQTTRFAISRAVAVVYAVAALAEGYAATRAPEIALASRVFVDLVGGDLARAALAFGDAPLAHRLLEGTKTPPSALEGVVSVLARDP